ncbi:MAG: response regulator [Desulfobacterales bacterium]|nr:response regulator [Desulfobacterales bacterium]
MNDKKEFSGGYNILLAEDDKMNQMVVTGLIKMLNIGHVEIVKNGKEAVNMFNAHRFDLILMDGEMPEMNGIDATLAIRAIEKDKGLSRTPIIALTAHTSQEAKTRFLNSGMDDFLEKPPNPDALAKAVQNVIRQGRSETKPEKIRDSENTVDVQKLKRIMAGKKPLLDKCLQTFEASYPTLISKMTACIEQNEYDELKENAHRLNGMLKYLAALNASALAEHLESMGDAGNATSTDLTSQVRALDDECLKIIDIIKQVLTEDFP